ncbi:major facilitator superfamily domain-containing protein [Roridomyces roridus]|uniref:Major facilitator superfamily domain-containing protein n=1 Tax=Roridomyces roridus TaxID=1738132 RepID=A0AAD7B0V7_9AGAR|nr:major facilitator superfamily domain-containing protein [Roridomyces roridus]
MSTTTHHQSLEEKRAASAELTARPIGIEIPDRGFQAWATVAGSFLIMFCGFGYSTSFGVYQDFYVREYLLRSSSSTISWIGSVNIFIVLTGGFVAGRLHDRGYFYPLMYGGSLLMALSLFSLSFAQTNQFYQVFLTQGIANGIGAGMTYVPCVAVISHHFKKRRALAMTLRRFWFFPRRCDTSNHAQQDALRYSTWVCECRARERCSHYRSTSPRVLSDADASPATAKVRTSLSRLCTNSPATGRTVSRLLGLESSRIGFYYPLFYLQLDATKHGIDPTFAFYALVIMNASSFIGRLFPGLVSHRWSVKTMITVAAGCATVSLYGFFAGFIVSLMGPLFAILTDDLSELGTRIGLSFAFSGLGILVGPPIDGLLLTNDFVWWRPALFSGVMALAGFGCFLGATFELYAHVAPTPMDDDPRGIEFTQVDLDVQAHPNGRLKLCAQYTVQPHSKYPAPQIILPKGLSVGLSHLRFAQVWNVEFEGWNMVARLYDPLYVSDDTRVYDIFRQTNEHVGTEVAAYAALSRFQGSLSPSLGRLFLSHGPSSPRARGSLSAQERAGRSIGVFFPGRLSELLHRALMTSTATRSGIYTSLLSVTSTRTQFWTQCVWRIISSFFILTGVAHTDLMDRNVLPKEAQPSRTSFCNSTECALQHSLSTESLITQLASQSGGEPVDYSKLTRQQIDSLPIAVIDFGCIRLVENEVKRMNATLHALAKHFGTDETVGEHEITAEQLENDSRPDSVARKDEFHASWHWSKWLPSTYHYLLLKAQEIADTCRH